MGELVEPLGFDSLWATEHDVSAYSMQPNPLQYPLNVSLRHEVARLIVWHAVSTRMLIEGGRPLLSFGSGFPTSSSPHRTSTFQRIRRSNSGSFRIFAPLIALRSR
jgi:hypothetical protein